MVLIENKEGKINVLQIADGLNMSVSDLAKNCGIESEHLEEVATGKKGMYAYELLAIADYTGLDLKRIEYRKDLQRMAAIAEWNEANRQEHGHDEFLLNYYQMAKGILPTKEADKEYLRSRFIHLLIAEKKDINGISDVIRHDMRKLEQIAELCNCSDMLQDIREKMEM